ncbi:MAG: TrkA family potassium uptake protein [Arcobacter sp.]|jgi:trk system potassium uptake protein TrkA|uniref:Potassium transporter KtrAB, KtrA subunit n=1 Tax=Arcobacter defluvii TaxID=873191 RepID=A0AAE7BH79_9BACT|nr:MULTISPECIES: TrkA family potassium uptake protein [Arcobacter]MDY3199549.1 TrkA family potassium uptake protein [Arcobacter sp.]QKF77687.1 potassium transporter KtrAB, KtrA subunit [Arcobacter defluvii]RXI34341.1 potassium transporter TrkA [Arcobacter defluvii]
MKTIAVIGLGRFGFYVAKSLSRLDVKVIAVDNDEKKVQEISEFIDDAYIIDSINKQALEEVGIYNLDTVIVSIGENIEASILTVMALKDLNNKTIIAKAINSTHGEILSKIGAYKVVYPEKIAGRMLVKKLVDTITVEEIDISNSIKMIKLFANEKFINKKIFQIENEFKNLKIVSYKSSGNWFINIDSSYEIKKDDLLVFICEVKYVKDFLLSVK